jgi:1-acyl-sn-glycerol-3-phosphate acyltransferase
VAAKEYWKRNAIRKYLSSKVFRAILNSRGNPGELPSPIKAEAIIRRMVDEMAERFSLIVFPEGTRGSGDDVIRSRAACFIWHPGNPMSIWCLLTWRI